MLRPAYKPLRRIVRFASWAFTSQRNLVLDRASRNSRILVIYDTSSQPFSLGDLLVFQAASLVLAEKHKVDFVDFVIVYDPADPASSDPAFAGTVTEDNVLYHVASLLPLAQVNQKLGSFFVFNSHDQVHRLIADNSDKYYVWPTAP